ncbi:MAG: TraC family protein [Patescibacteria group bacterium]
MQSAKLAGNKITTSTQMFLDIAEIKNDTVILKDGTLRAVLVASSVNFALKSEEEQSALVSSYVSFLNYIDYPLQIVVQSRKLDIGGYIKKIEEIERTQTNELLKKQVSNYKAYVKELIDLNDIMSKRFFIVIPYSPIEDKKRGFLGRMSSVLSPSKVIKLKQDKFNSYLHELNQRVEHVRMNVSSMDITAQRLDTQGLIELYYEVYNPQTSQSQKLGNIEKLRVEDNLTSMK